MARFSSPEGLLLLPSRILLIADRGNNRVRMLYLSTGIVSTLVGPGSVNLTLPSGNFTQPGSVLGRSFSVTLCGPSHFALISDGSGIFISESCGGRVSFFSFNTGNVSVVAGSGAPSSVSSVSLSSPKGLAWNAGTGLFIADYGANNIKQLAANLSSIAVYAGSGSAVPSTGPALKAGISGPRALA